tara:strand:+ start:5033 stop:5824 length:792 start_codon:yes stop_codon:yes gene_type:complete
MRSQRIECEKSGKIVIIKADSPRRLQLSPIYKGGEVYEKGVLIAIDFDGEFAVEVGKTVAINRQRYKVGKISKIMSTEGSHMTGYHLHITELNKSSMFVMPLLGYNRGYYRWNTDFVNCFIGTEDDGSDYTIYLWYKYTASIEMETLEGRLKEHPSFVSQEDVDQYHVLYKFSVPEKYVDDYMLILDGKYSYISEVAKERILDFHSSKKDRPLGKILYRDPERRRKIEKELGVTILESADLHDPFYEEDELYYNKNRLPKPAL